MLRAATPAVNKAVESQVTAGPIADTITADAVISGHAPQNDRSHSLVAFDKLPELLLPDNRP